MPAPGKSQPSNPGPSSPAASGILRALPSGVWALGFVSLFMDISSELIHSLLPVFMSSVLGAPATFLAGAVFAALAVFGLLAYRKQPSTVGPGVN